MQRELEGRGLGQQIMERLMGYLQSNAQAGAFVGLMAAKGAEGFYYRIKPRPQAVRPEELRAILGGKR